jgi:hypothetical protein
LDCLPFRIGDGGIGDGVHNGPADEEYERPETAAQDQDEGHDAEEQTDSPTPLPGRSLAPIRLAVFRHSGSLDSAAGRRVVIHRLQDRRLFGMFARERSGSR